MAQHEGGYAVATGQFDLGASFTRLQAANKRAQGQEHGADVGWQDGAALHVGDVAAFALMKADEYRAFFSHITHR